MPVSAIRKETALPGIFFPNQRIFVARADNPALMDAYMVNATGDGHRRTLNTDEVEAMIAAPGLSGAGAATVVSNIAARDAIASPDDGMLIIVRDASGDPTVDSGSATYGWMAAETPWEKLAEFESLDTVMAWTNITGRPTSTPAQIDSAVTNSHTHANATQLDLIGQDGSGNLTYSGALPRAAVTVANW